MKNRPWLAYPKKEGENIKFRILPPFRPLSLQWHTFARAIDTAYHTFQCPRRLVAARWEGYCPACEYVKELYGAGLATGDIEEAKRLRAWERHYYNVFDRADNFPKGFAAFKATHQHLLTYILGDPDQGIAACGDITDMTTGRDVIVHCDKIMAGKYPNYQVILLQPGPFNEEAEICNFFSEWPDDFEDVPQDHTTQIEYVIEHFYRHSPRKRRMWRSIDEPWSSQ
jgi:hypothetical protein